MFVKNILKNKKINIFNYGNHERSFTYVDDIVDGIIKVINKIPKKTNIKKLKKLTPDKSYSPFTIINLGNDKSVKLMRLVNKIENFLNKKSKKQFLKIQLGDIQTTKAEISKIKNMDKNFAKTNIDDGLKKFIKWFKEYYKFK